MYNSQSNNFLALQGGMSNELYNTIARVTDGIYEGSQIFLLLLCFMLIAAFTHADLGCNTICVCFGTSVGIAIGGDVFPGSTLSDHVLRFNNIPQVCHCLPFLCYHWRYPIFCFCMQVFQILMVHLGICILYLCV